MWRVAAGSAGVKALRDPLVYTRGFATSFASTLQIAPG